MIVRTSNRAGLVDNAFNQLRQDIGPIREFLKVTARGVFPCPFPEHEDRNPSCNVFTNSHGIEYLKCFGCGFYGDRVDVVAKITDRTLGQVLSENTQGQSFEGRKRSQEIEKQTRVSRKILVDPDVNQLFRASIEFAKTGHPKAMNAIDYLYFERGLHTGHSVGNELTGVIPHAAHWRGQELKSEWCVATPLYHFLPPTPTLKDMDQAPVDLALRAVTEISPKVKSLYKACPGAVKSFGIPRQAILEAEGTELIIVEGQLNFVRIREAYRPYKGILGLHGATTAKRVSAAIRDQICFLRRNGVDGPSKIVIDTDYDTSGAGDSAAQHLANMALSLSICVERIDRSGCSK